MRCPNHHRKALPSKCFRIFKKTFKLAVNAFVAQVVEQLTLNQWVEGSTPSERTIKNKGLQIETCKPFFVFPVSPVRVKDVHNCFSYNPLLNNIKSWLNEKFRKEKHL